MSMAMAEVKTASSLESTAVMMVGGKHVRQEWASYLFELQLGPPANVGVGVEGCYYATSNGGGIHLDVKMRACTYRGWWVVCLEAKEEGRGSVLMRVSSVCSALRAAVRWVNNLLAGRKAGRCRAGHSGARGNQL